MEVTLLDTMGSDLTVANAARVSFSKESIWDADDEGTLFLKNSDAKLIDYLAKHNHWTPFAHCFAQFRIKAPIFVARQLVKHQVGLVWNEESRRYIDSEPEFYLPAVWRSRPDGSIKQGSGGAHPESGVMHEMAEQVTENSLMLYQGLIEKGFAPEQARMLLPLNAMTEWYWSGSIAAFARVCKLRLDPHAQAETAEIAQGISDALAPKFNVSWKALS